MLFKFKSQAAADLIMLEGDARRLLKIMLGDDPVKGIVLTTDIAAALSALESAVAQDEAARQQRSERAQAGITADENEQVQPDPVRLAQRAAPMLKLLKISQAQASDVVWGV